ncbi:MAG: aminotransferase [Shinella sp.]|jgi:uncharacterized protein (DUF2249 family)|nr:MAG: aminotransferase [Shinella sp.]
MTATADQKPSIDVRVIPHAERHPKIFGMLSALKPGDAMDVTADHDPRPLHYHLDSQYPGLFGWSYLERGPDVWRVEIERLKAEGHECTCGGH